MALYDFRYRLQSTPQPRTDGTGGIDCDVFAVSRLSGTSNDFAIIPGQHMTVVLLAPDLKVVNDMPEGTTSEMTAKRRAFKNLLKAYLRAPTPVTPIVDWTEEGLQALLDANDSAVLEANRIDTFIRIVLGKSYPWDVQINV